MIAWGVCKFVDTATVSVMMTIFPGDDLSVIDGIIINGAFGLSNQRSNFGRFIKPYLILIGEHWRIKCQYSYKKCHNYNELHLK